MRGNKRVVVFLLASFLAGASVLPSQSQDVVSPIVESKKSPAKAFALSALLPGLGQRYVNNGSWGGSATWFALADASTIAGLVVTDWRHGVRVENYETLAVSRAGADINGKDRTFFLNLATYTSSDEFLEVSLRNRAWDQVDYVSDASFEWAWATEEDFNTFRSERNRAESLSRRRSLLVAVLVGNRLISGFTAALGARSKSSRVELGLTPFIQERTRIGGRIAVDLSR